MAMDARNERRFPVRYPISFEGIQGVGEGTLFNLSAGGCAIESTTPAQLSAAITLRLRIPTKNMSLEVDQAKVTWTGGQHFGVQFLHLEPQEKDRLQELIADLKNEPLPLAKVS